MKKRVLAIAACVAIVLSFSACGADETTQAVIDSISAIDVQSLTIDDRDTLLKIDESYNSLTDDQQKKVSNYDAFSEALTRMEEIVDEEEQKLEGACLADVNAGLVARWDALGNTSSTLDEYVANLSSAIGMEYDAVIAHKDDVFYDDEFKANLDAYIAALESQKEGIGYFLTDKDAYNETYVNAGYVKRAECLKNLVDKYGFSVEKKYANRLENASDPSVAGTLADLDETIPVTCEYGDAEIAVEGAEISDAWTGYAMGYEIQEGQSILLVKLVVENIDYEDQYNPGYMSLEDYTVLTDLSNITIDPLGSAWEYGGYDNAAGGFFEIGAGETKKVVVPYVVDEDMESAILTVGDYIVPLEF